MNKIYFVVMTFILLSGYAPTHAQGVAFADNLQCEHLVNPLGIDAPAPRLSWLLNDSRYGAVQTAYRIVIDTDSAAVAAGKGDIWDTQKVISDRILATYAGKKLEPFTRYFWSVTTWDKDGKESVPTVASFETGMMEITNWKGIWISDGHLAGGNGIDVKPTPYLRKEFTTQKKPIKSARVYIAVAGLYELYVNGEKIGDHRLDPMYTRFDRRNLYLTYDVTKQLQNGQNALGVLLGNGWYNHQTRTAWTPWRFDAATWRNRPAFCLDVRITYTDGSTETVSSDLSWKTNASPVIFNSIYTGEQYDARLEQPGWNKPGYIDTAWKEPLYRTAPSHQIVTQQLHPIRNVEKVNMRSCKKINDRTYMFDLGRNIAGVSQLRVKGEAGTEIRLAHGEILRPDGMLDKEHLWGKQTDDSDPFATDIYILSGKGEEVFMPRFNYKGFQYVEVVADKPIELTAESLTGWFMHSDVPPVGHVETSNPLVNRIWQATNSSYLSNLFGYPTDCPHREKNGWTGDAHIAIETGFYNFDAITVYEKWLADHRDEQQPNGALPNFIPSHGGYTWGNGIDWVSTIAIIPWQTYLFYGDSRMLADCYDNIKRYINYMTDSYPSGLIDWGLGDWIPVKSQSPIELTSSIYYYTDATILAKAAELFGKPDDKEKYSALADKIKAAINRKYLNREKAIYGQGMQTELSAALFWDIVPEELRDKVAANLAKQVEADDKHVDVGLLGSKTILNALSENGYADLAYTVAAQETYPSWGYWMVHDNATTLYESWSAIGSGEVSSLNHIMFGEIGAWFYKALGGIHPDKAHPGFKNILLKPNFVRGLNHASVSFESPYGKIESRWERKKKTVIYNVTIPANATADFYLPAGYKIGKVTLTGGKTIALPETGKGIYRLVAGSYEIMNNEQ